MLDIRETEPLSSTAELAATKEMPSIETSSTQKAPIPYFRRQAFAREIVLESGRT